MPTPSPAGALSDRAPTRKRRALLQLERPPSWAPSVGSDVEARITDEGFRGSVYEGRVILLQPRASRCVIRYSTLLAEDGSGAFLSESILVSQVRPRPPRAAGAAATAPLAVHQLVDAFHQDGWWRAVVIAEADESGEYQVTFPTTGEVERFKRGELRPCLEWDGRRWVSPESMVGDPLYCEGAVVEVWKHREPYGISWFPATVLKVIERMYFVVKYDNWPTTEEPGTVILDSRYLRPKSLMLHLDMKEVEKGGTVDVEAFCEGGWSPGIISEVLAKGDSCRYKVRMNGEQLFFLECDAQHVRPRFEWIDGEWKKFSEMRKALKSNDLQSRQSAQSSNSKPAARQHLAVSKQKSRKHLGRSFIKHSASKKTTKRAKSKTPASREKKLHGLISSEMNDRKEVNGHDSRVSTNATNENSYQTPTFIPTAGLSDEEKGTAHALNLLTLHSNGSSRIPLQPSQASHQDVDPTEAPIEPSDLQCVSFEKTSSLWASLEGMEVFKRVPQKPHFQQVKKNYPESHHEGMAFGLMMTFATCAESIEKLQMKDDIGIFEEKKKSLDMLEANGFNVQFLKSHLCGLLRRRVAEFSELTEMLGKTISEKEMNNAELDSSIFELEQFLSLLRLRLDVALLKKSCNSHELTSLRKELDEVRIQHEEASRLVSFLDASQCCDEASTITTQEL